MLKVFPVYVNMLLNRGKYLEAYGRYDEARQLYERALVLSPGSAIARQALNDLRRRNRN